MSCEVKETLESFADGSLGPLEAERVAAHLEGCRACAEVVDGPFARFKAGYRPRRAPERLRSSVRWATRGRERRPLGWWGGAAAGALAAGLLLWLGPAARRETPEAATLERIAVRAHQAYLDHAAPLDVETADPATLARTLAGRFKLGLQLPPMAGAGFALVGARIIQTGAALGAMLVYRQGEELVSLTAAPRGAVRLAEGTVERFRGVDFHLSELDGRHVVQWTEGQMSYALVSSAAGRTRASCDICHAPGLGLSQVDGFHAPQ
jgi:anti-sigma factor RsiW